MLVRTAVRLAVCALGIAGFAQEGAAATAASVEFVIGGASAIDAAGASRPLAKGASVQTGDTIDTGSGRVQLRFSDGAYVSLQPGSQFRIDDYNYNGRNDDTERGFFSLIKGGLRTITGLVGRTNRRNYQVRVPVATIGIRGTEYTLLYDGQAVGSVGEGEISVCNQGGCLNVGSGQAYLVSDVNVKPELTTAQSFLPPPPPPRFVGRQSEDEHPNPAESYIDVNLFVAGDQVNQLIAQTPPAPTPPAPELFGEQIGNTGAPVTTQGVVLSLATIVFPGALSGIETGTITRATLADIEEGRLISWFDSGVGTPISTIGTAAIADRGNLGQIAWGRFTSGTLGNGSAVGDPAGSFAGKQVTATDSVHYVVAKATPVENLPVSGSISYTALAGATTPTTGAGTAQLLSAGLSANFTTSQVTANVSVLGSDNKRADFIGGSIIAGNLFGGGGSATGTACPQGCGGDFSGVFAGPVAQHAGFTYSIDGASFGNARGAVVLRRTP